MSSVPVCTVLLRRREVVTTRERPKINSTLGEQETPETISNAVNNEIQDAFAFRKHGESPCRHGDS